MFECRKQFRMSLQLLDERCTQCGDPVTLRLDVLLGKRHNVPLCLNPQRPVAVGLPSLGDEN